MSIRLRIVNGAHVALCAAKTEAEEGDIYLDDAWHEAIAAKYWRDYEEITIVDKQRFAIMSALEQGGTALPWPEPVTPSRGEFHRKWSNYFNRVPPCST